MFKPTDILVAELRNLYGRLASVECGREARLRRELDTRLSQRRPDVTDDLLAAAQAAREHGLDLGGQLTAACCRAACARLGKQHPGASIEVRVPPVAAVQIGFESGSTHTRGTPPNVVEMAPLVFIDLAVGHHGWDTARPQVRSSGAHAHEVERVFPLWVPAPD